MDALIHRLISLLPYNLQTIIANPPSLSDPQSFIPVFQLLLPYTKYILIFTSIYIVYSFVTNIFGMFSRLLRFGMKIGPIIGLVAWLMNNSGQGSFQELTDLVKSYFGLSQAGQGQANWGNSPGIASLAGLFNTNTDSNTNKNKYAKSKAKTNSWTGSGSDPISSRTRNNKNKNKQGDSATPGSAGEIFENLVNEATKEENVDFVQDYVKNSLMKAAGVDWLFGSGSTDKKEEKKKLWTR
ncbi:uncharacterized protein I303_101972 [Kwoniella dejecticola CBS 10117]|uniref:Uncharacterized protein n=1 Tax=Kwoniella dejecticola CBS 10117 TaxID=1296121 RepID=A0A1A6ACA2_9TREE|nr:uncharacterized protein I303_01892 [Kwoniella dejecticola CBS 10117]OBR87684.1 hypothetical protein I303_01892 [Kwoniella dejecticola CBS 10117]